MKYYVNYFDNIEAPESLTEKLAGLEEPRKTYHIYRWAAAAAAVAVVLGAGAVWHFGNLNSELDTTPNTGVSETSTPETGTPDIAIEDSSGSNTGASSTVGGYEMVDGDGEEGIVSHYTLPALNFQPATTQVAMDYALGYSHREATQEEIGAVLGESWRIHLRIPEDAEISSEIYFDKEGEIGGFDLRANWDKGDIYIEQLIGCNVPTCCVSQDELYGHTDVDGVDVVTLTWDNDASDGVDADNTCEVKFFVRDTGWKAKIVGENYEELTERFARLGVYDTDTGLATAFGNHPGTPDDSPGEINEFTTPSYDPTR